MTRSVPLPARHQLRLTGHPAYGWAFECLHGPDEFWMTDEAGNRTGEEGCWVQTWWDELGMELIDDRRPWPEPSSHVIPVDIDGGDEPIIVPHAVEVTR